MGIDNEEKQVLMKPTEEIIDFIIHQYGEEIKRLIFTYVKNHAQTDDIFQEVLIKAYQNINQFEGKSRLKTWLYRIAINKSKDYLKSPIHRILQYKDHILSERNDYSAEKKMLSNEKEKMIVQAILSLPIKYREVFVLKYYRSFSVKQISEAIGVNESTVKTRIMRGKQKLRTKLGGDFLEQYE